MTSKELSFINDILSAEKSSVRKCQEYSNTCTDSSLKDLCNQIASKHQQNYDSIYNTLNL